MNRYLVLGYVRDVLTFSESTFTRKYAEQLQEKLETNPLYSTVKLSEIANPRRELDVKIIEYCDTDSVCAMDFSSMYPAIMTNPKHVDDHTS